MLYFLYIHCKIKGNIFYIKQVLQHIFYRHCIYTSHDNGMLRIIRTIVRSQSWIEHLKWKWCNERPLIYGLLHWTNLNCFLQSTLFFPPDWAQSARVWSINTRIFNNIILIVTYRICAWSPTSRAHLTVSIRVLEGLYQSDGLIHWASHGEIVHCYLSQHTALINNEKTTQSMTTCLQVNTIILANLVR